MLSIASVKSAAGAGKYFTNDDFVSGEYYTDEKAGDVSMWGGAGAAEAGLKGTVTREAFTKALEGELPSGKMVDQRENRRPGYDLTFSAPKSVSVMAYIAGDKRILGPDGVHAKAVQQTMAWVEKNLAEARIMVDGKQQLTKTGNLVYALFQHDTSRALDPQSHFHSILANLTKGQDGKWYALNADKIWSSNTVIGSIYHAYFRAGVEKIGYKTELSGKHGTFEISGVPKAVLEHFSKRRDQILTRAQELGIFSPKGRDGVTVKTRDPKLNVEDKSGLQQGWIDDAASIGFDGKDLLAAAERAAPSNERSSPLDRGYEVVANAVQAAWKTVSGMLQSPDPLVDRGLVRLSQSVGQANAQLAVASAIRIHGQREAAFENNRVAKTALDLGLKGVTIDHVEARLERLLEKGKLLGGEIRVEGKMVSALTTPEALKTEERILQIIDDGKGKATPIIAAADAPDRVQAASPNELNPGQLAAASLLLSSPDKVVVVQGIAGSGKSTMLQAVASVATAEGKKVLGLAFQNKMVADLKEGMAPKGMSAEDAKAAGIDAQTIASFIWHNERHLTSPNTAAAQAKREEYKDTTIVIDETSMVSNNDMLKLLTIAQALGIERIGQIGDKQQLLPIDAGKAFSVMQAWGVTMARMDENIRQRTDQLRTVAALANAGKASQALRVLGDKVVEHENPAERAAELWLALPKDERADTAIFASGRETRATINREVQAGLLSEGSLKGEGLHLTVHQSVHTVREELRYAKTYVPGQQFTITGDVQELRLGRGSGEITRTFANGKVEFVTNGRKIRFDPQRIDPMNKTDRLELSTLETIKIYEGDKLRWTATDKDRGINSAATATVTGIENGRVTVELHNKQSVTLEHNDPMLSRVDLAYALNMHMAQGVTASKAITAMISYEYHLSNQRLMTVGVTRIRDDLIMVVDDQKKLERQLDRNPGDKTSSMESLGMIDTSGVAEQTKAANDALSAAMATLDQQDKEQIRIEPAALDMAELPPMGKSETDYSDKAGLETITSMRDVEDGNKENKTGAVKGEQEFGLRPLDMDDLSGLPALPGRDGSSLNLPQKQISMDM